MRCGAFRFGASAATLLKHRCTLAYAVTDAAAAAEELAERRLGERVYKLLGFVVTKALASHRGVCIGCVHYGYRSGNTPLASAGSEQCGDMEDL